MPDPRSGDTDDPSRRVRWGSSGESLLYRVCRGTEAMGGAGADGPCPGVDPRGNRVFEPPDHRGTSDQAEKKALHHCHVSLCSLTALAHDSRWARFLPIAILAWAANVPLLRWLNSGEAEGQVGYQCLADGELGARCPGTQRAHGDSRHQHAGRARHNSCAIPIGTWLAGCIGGGSAVQSHKSPSFMHSHPRRPARNGTSGFCACRLNADQGRAEDPSGQHGIERRATWTS